MKNNINTMEESKQCTSITLVNVLTGIGFSESEAFGLTGEILKKRDREREGYDQAQTFANIYRQYYENRFGRYAPKDLTGSSRSAVAAAYKHLEPFHERSLDSVGVMELQEFVNEKSKVYSKSTVRNILSLIKGLYRFAIPRDLCTKKYGLFVDMPRVREEKHHEAFDDEELALLWANRADPVVRMILVMCYSGFRIAAWQGMMTYFDEIGRGSFVGGVKTEAGKNRVVPIYSGIVPLVCQMPVGKLPVQEDSLVSVSGILEGRQRQVDVEYLCGKSKNQFRRDMKRVLAGLGIRPLTPHSCRHTFNRLLEKAGVGDADRKRLMGHSLKGDLINGTYGHRSVEDLRNQIEKITIPKGVGVI